MKSSQQTFIKDASKENKSIIDQIRLSKDQCVFDQQTAPCTRQLIYSKLIELNDKQLSLMVKKKDFRKAISILNEIQKQINNQHNQSCRTDKLLFYHQLSVCYYNYAAVYQKVNNDIEASNYFQKSLKNYQCMQGYINNRQQSASYSIQLSKLHIQFCSILSQNGKHQEAIIFAEKALQKIIESFRFLQAICFEIIMTSKLPQTNSNSKDSRTKIELVNFKKQVLTEADKLLKQLSSLPQAHQITTQFKNKYDSLMQKVFFWKDNAQNNQKLLRKELQISKKQINSSRNILGVQKNSLFNQNLTLQSLTNLEIKFINYTFKTDPFLLMSIPKLTEMAFYVSMIYFMLATQIRFSQNDLNMNKLKIDEKYKKLSRDQRMIKCKMIHMKAIQIAGKFLPQKNEFFTHILNRFNKNYKCVMEEINEQSREQSMKDFEPQKIIEPEKEIFPQHQYGIQKNQSLIKSMNLRQETINSPSLGSAKKIKKTKTITLSENFHEKQQAKKRIMSSSKFKQNQHNFHKHKRSSSQSQSHKRTLSFQNRQRQKNSAKIKQEKMLKKNNYEDNLIEKQKEGKHNVNTQGRKQAPQLKQAQNYKHKMVLNPSQGKRKLSSSDIQIYKKQQTGMTTIVSQNKRKIFLFHKKQFNN